MCKADVIYARDLEQCWGQDVGTYRKVKNHIMVLVVCTVTILSSITGTFTSISSITENLTISSVSNASLQCAVAFAKKLDLKNVRFRSKLRRVHPDFEYNLS